MGEKPRLKHSSAVRSLRYAFPFKHADVAQLVEHLVANEKVAGSNPVVRSGWNDSVASAAGSFAFPPPQHRR